MKSEPQNESRGRDDPMRPVSADELRAKWGLEPQNDSGESCGTCRYSDPRIADDDTPYLRCRRYPPIVTMLDTPDPVSVFAQTDADEWCGEWTAVDAG